jgi:hypothetical protein
MTCKGSRAKAFRKLSAFFLYPNTVLLFYGDRRLSCIVKLVERTICLGCLNLMFRSGEINHEQNHDVIKKLISSTSDEEYVTIFVY